MLRALLEEHFADMDNSLREIGVGDLSVPKKIHRMIDALYGRFENYEKASEWRDTGRRPRRCAGPKRLSAMILKRVTQRSRRVSKA